MRAKKITYRPALLMNQCITVIVLDRKTKTSRVDVLVNVNKECAKDGLREEIQYAVEHRFGVGSNDVCTYVQKCKPICLIDALENVPYLRTSPRRWAT